MGSGYCCGTTSKIAKCCDNDRVDLHAAPGSKTAQLISTGAKVIAVEKNQKRINQLEKNLKRLKLKADLVLADGTKFRPKHPVDLVLLDAPCSGTGTIRRRPDILNHRVAANITLLQKIQWQLLTSALDWLNWWKTNFFYLLSSTRGRGRCREDSYSRSRKKISN